MVLDDYRFCCVYSSRATAPTCLCTRRAFLGCPVGFSLLFLFFFLFVVYSPWSVSLGTQGKFPFLIGTMFGATCVLPTFVLHQGQRCFSVCLLLLCSLLSQARVRAARQDEEGGALSGKAAALGRSVASARRR